MARLALLLILAILAVTANAIPFVRVGIILQENGTPVNDIAENPTPPGPHPPPHPPRPNITEECSAALHNAENLKLVRSSCLPAPPDNGSPNDGDAPDALSTLAEIFGHAEGGKKMFRRHAHKEKMHGAPPKHGAPKHPDGPGRPCPFKGIKERLDAFCSDPCSEAIDAYFAAAKDACGDQVIVPPRPSWHGRPGGPSEDAPPAGLTSTALFDAELEDADDFPMRAFEKREYDEDDEDDDDDDDNVNLFEGFFDRVESIWDTVMDKVEEFFDYDDPVSPPHDAPRPPGHHKRPKKMHHRPPHGGPKPPHRGPAHRPGHLPPPHGKPPGHPPHDGPAPHHPPHGAPPHPPHGAPPHPPHGPPPHHPPPHAVLFSIIGLASRNESLTVADLEGLVGVTSAAKCVKAGEREHYCPIASHIVLSTGPPHFAHPPFGKPPGHGPPGHGDKHEGPKRGKHMEENTFPLPKDACACMTGETEALKSSSEELREGLLKPWIVPRAEFIKAKVCSE